MATAGCLHRGGPGPRAVGAPGPGAVHRHRGGRRVRRVRGRPGHEGVAALRNSQDEDSHGLRVCSRIATRPKWSRSWGTDPRSSSRPTWHPWSTASWPRVTAGPSPIPESAASPPTACCGPSRGLRRRAFVLVTDGSPSTKATSGSNTAHVSARVNHAPGWVVTLCALDSTSSGACGQAIRWDKWCSASARRPGFRSQGPIREHHRAQGLRRRRWAGRHRGGLPSGRRGGGHGGRPCRSGRRRLHHEPGGGRAASGEPGPSRRHGWARHGGHLDLATPGRGDWRGRPRRRAQALRGGRG